MTLGLQTLCNLTRYTFHGSKGTIYSIVQITYESGKFGVEMTPDNPTIRNAVIEEVKATFPIIDPKALQERINKL